MGLFDRVEGKLERAYNGIFARAFRAEVQPVEIASAIRRAMDDLVGVPIVVPVWNQTTGEGSGARYRVVGYAEVAITSYHLPGSSRISAIYRGMVNCAQ